MDWTTLLIALLGGGNLIQLITLIVYRKKNRAETETIAIKNMQLVIGSMQEEIKRLQVRNTELEKQVSDLENIIHKIHL